jgi:hypothetical protein
VSRLTNHLEHVLLCKGYYVCRVSFKHFTDQGPVFLGHKWRERCRQASIILRATETESHNSLGDGETYHSMLRRIYSKVSLNHSNLPGELRLALSVKAMNDTAGPNGMVPFLLLFGVVPKFPGE